jgi:hypothetical protein
METLTLSQFINAVDPGILEYKSGERYSSFDKSPVDVYIHRSKLKVILKVGEYGSQTRVPRKITRNAPLRISDDRQHIGVRRSDEGYILTPVLSHHPTPRTGYYLISLKRGKSAAAGSYAPSTPHKYGSHNYACRMCESDAGTGFEGIANTKYNQIRNIQDNAPTAS